MEIIPGDDLEAHDPKRTKVQTMTAITKTLLLDIAQLILLILPIIVLYIWRKKLGFKTGFFCNDNSIRYPYVKSMVSTGSIIFQTLLGPPIILTITEMLKRFKKQKMSYIGGVIYTRIIRFCHGYFICACLTSFPKFFQGNLRPHFMEVCDPDIDCSDKMNQYRFIEDYQCRGDNVSMNVYVSFPSGHTSGAVFASVYLILYLWKQVKWNKLRICLQVLLLVYAYSISYSRIADHYHHPSDVIAGAIIGALTAFASVKYIENFFRDPTKKKCRRPSLKRLSLTQEV